MQYPAAADPDCSSGARAAMLEGSLSCLWPSNNPEDVIRRALAVLLCEDPDHRLRVAHLEPLLHMALGPQQLPCSSGRLQALLTDPSTAKIFPVDFSAQVPDWRSRVVHLDMHQLNATLSAAKAHRQQQQQHADASGVDQDADACLQRGSSSGCSESAALDSHLVAPPPDGERLGGSSVTDPPQQSTGSHNRPAPLALDSIFGSSSAFTGGGLPAGRASSQAGGAAAGSMQVQPGHHSSSMPAVTPTEPGSDSRDSGSGHQGMSSSLFGGSFEVPYAIASCWATGNQAGSFGTAHPGAKGHPVLADTLGAAADGGGSSSMASSTRSFAGPAAASAGAAGAMPARPATGSSRLRNASSMQGGDGAAGEPAAANSIDVCTPRSGIAAPAGADRSPLLSSADCEEDAGEYSEAALVFGSVSNAAGGGAALAAAGGEDRGAASGRTATGERSASSGLGGPAADSSGQLEAEESFSMQGVDWSCMAGLQQQQQQPEAAYHDQQQAAQQQQHALLFGLDDFGGDGLTPRSSGAGAAGGPASAAAHNRALAAAATGALTARRLLMEHAGLREDCPTGSFHNPNALLGSHHSPHHLAALASSLGALGSGSAPATLQQQQQHEQLLLAAAAAAGSGRAFGGYGHERLLLDPEGLQGYGLSGPQHMAALASSLQGGSYGSGGLLGSDRSLGSGLWASPAAMQQHFLLQQQHQRQQQQAVAAAAVAAAAAAAQSQQQQMRASLGGGADGTIDTSFGIDQMGKMDQQHPVGSAGTPGKGGSLAANAFGRPAGSHGGQQELAAKRSSSSSSGPPGASALTPRLTGWASVAAKEPPAGSGPQQQQQQQAQSQGSATLHSGMKQGQAGSTGCAASKAGGDGGQGKAVARLPPRVKAEVQHLVSQFQGVLKLEDFDDGVVHQLNAKRSEDEAVAAVRNIAHYELGTIQHMAAYLNHVVKNFNAAAAAAAAAAADTTVGLSNALAAAAAVAANSAAAVHGGSAATAATMQQLLGAGMLSGNGSLGSTVGAGRGGPAGGAGAAAGLGAYGGQIRLTSVPVSTKAMLQKLPLKVFKQIELLVQNSAYLEWRHFDAGVIKVLSQLSKLCEGDVFEELELLAATDLSSVEYMPAYLNKRLNNKLWSRRKAEGHVPG